MNASRVAGPAAAAHGSTRLNLFGRFQLLYGAEAADVPVGGQRVLAFLGLRNHATRTVLAGTLWPDVTEERAQGASERPCGGCGVGLNSSSNAATTPCQSRTGSASMCTV